MLWPRTVVLIGDAAHATSPNMACGVASPVGPALQSELSAAAGSSMTPEACPIDPPASAVTRFSDDDSAARQGCADTNARDTAITICRNSATSSDASPARQFMITGDVTPESLSGR